MTEEKFVPLTIEGAVGYLLNSLSEEEIAFIKKEKDHSCIHFGLGMQIRNDWGLWRNDTAIKLDAVEKYGIAHGDDLSSLIFAWLWAKVKNETFDPIVYCQNFHEHWKLSGTDSLSAGCWVQPTGWRHIDEPFVPQKEN